MFLRKKSIVIALAFLTLFGCGGEMKQNSTLADGIFQSCPSSPNCVSSMEEGKQYIQPLSYSGEVNEALSIIKREIASLSDVSLVEQNDHYLHYAFKSKLFRFVDDFEIYLPDGQQVVHLRSASRLGYYDFGVNRKRVETIKQLLIKTEFFQ